MVAPLSPAVKLAAWVRYVANKRPNNARSLRLLKVRQWRRLFAKLLVDRSVAPLKDQAAVLRLISYPAFLWLVFLAGGFRLLTDEALISWAAFQALVYTFPLFILVNLVTSIFGTSDEIRKRGTWFGRRFVFHEPLRVYTTEFGPSDDNTTRRFQIDSAEPNSFVEFHLEHYGRLGVASVGPPGMPLHGFGVTRETRFGSRIDATRSTSLYFNCPKDSDPTIVRVYVISWGQ